MRVKLTAIACLFSAAASAASVTTTPPGEFHPAVDSVVTDVDFSGLVNSGAIDRVVAAFDAAKADRAWSRHTSGLGADAPTNTTWISTPKTVISGGLEWSQTVTPGASVWCLRSNGLSLGSEGETNGTFRITDLVGDGILEISKGTYREIGVDCSSVQYVSNNTALAVRSYNYDFYVNVQPTLMMSTNLLLRVWTPESEQSFATVTWSQISNGWRATVVSAPGVTMMFLFGVVSTDGETTIRHLAPTEMSYIVIGGVKFSLSAVSADGKTVLGLTRVN